VFGAAATATLRRVPVSPPSRTTRVAETVSKSDALPPSTTAASRPGVEEQRPVATFRVAVIASFD
jgi:hypothetical protein